MDCLCRPSRILTVRIVLLDETDFTYELKDDLPGQALLDVVFARLNLIETAYFGIRYVDEENQTHWVDPASRISRQLKYKSEPFDLYFGVKFYAADPCKLLEEITRYQLFLQVKQDVLQGRLPVSFELASELGAFVVQSELGDYDSRRHSKGYVSEFRLMPNQTGELETRVGELHQQLKGMPPATAELNYLDKVKWHDMYGVDLHPVLGEDSVEYFLGLTPSGIVVLRNKTTVAHYYWPRIAKVYYKGRYFMLRICDKNNELSTYGFETPRKTACKHLWRCCVEHHAFFRLVRVAPLQSTTGTSELLALGSRLRYSGRTEKQIAKDAMSAGRVPPAFTRMPSKRQPRRLIDDFLSGVKTVDSFIKSPEIKSISVQQQPSIQNYESPYRSTYSIPTSLAIRPYNGTNQYQHPHTAPATPDSPRSTRSAPWPRSQQRGLFGGNPSSPRSVRSISTRHSTHVPTHRYRSSSVESHSSNDSRSTRRQKHRHRRTSDNESELSRGSGRSGRSHHSHRKHRRSRHRRDSGSENDSTRARSYSGHRVSCGGSSELIDSTSQWREVQRRQADSHGQSSVQQASVTKSSLVARSLHSNDSHSDSHSHHKSRRHKKNKSPSDTRSRIWSSELAKHLQFDLVDTAGMTEDQLREIPYTVVETNHMKRTNAANSKVQKNVSAGVNSNSAGGAVCSSNSQGKDRVDRIRGLYFQSTNSNDISGTKNGSIRSASTISSRECERNSGLVRMMSSMSMGDFISPSASSLSPLDSSALRVSHEHTDSGLGADQDYAYSSERSSDSARYGTNKSSGASTGSHRKSGGGHFSNMIHQHSHQHTVSSNTRKPSIYPNLQQTLHQNSYKYSSLGPAPVHNTNTSNSITNNNNNINNNISQSSVSQIKYPTTGQNTSSSISSSQLSLTTATTIANNNRLINYTTFENNHYKFSLNSPNTVHGIYYDDRPQSSASYYYPSNGNRTSRGTKSDIGVPIRRQSKSNYNIVSRTKLASVKSDLAISDLAISNTGNLPTDDGNTLMSLSTSVNSNLPAYHISGSKTSDFSTIYKMDNNLRPIYDFSSNKTNLIKRNRNCRGEDIHVPNNKVEKCTGNSSQKSNDVMYYQFDNKSSYMQHQKQALRQSTSDPTSTINPNKPIVYGPLVFLDKKQQLLRDYPKSTSTPNTNTQPQSNSPCNEGLMNVTMSPSSKQMHQQFTHNHNQNPNTNKLNDSSPSNDCNPNRSSSLEIILTPIIQSRRRMQ